MKKDVETFLDNNHRLEIDVNRKTYIKFRDLADSNSNDYDQKKLLEEALEEKIEDVKDNQDLVGWIGDVQIDYCKK